MRQMETVQGGRSFEGLRPNQDFKCLTMLSLMTDIPADITAHVFNQVPGKYVMFTHKQGPRGIFSITGHEGGCEESLIDSTDGQKMKPFQATEQARHFHRVVQEIICDFLG